MFIETEFRLERHKSFQEESALHMHRVRVIKNNNFPFMLIGQTLGLLANRRKHKENMVKLIGSNIVLKSCSSFKLE